MLASRMETSGLDPVASGWYELSARLAARGHRVSVLCTDAPEPGEALEAPPGVSVSRPGPQAFVAALDAALAHTPDLVHVGVTGALPAGAVAHLERVPLLIDLVDWSPMCAVTDLVTRPQGEACSVHFPSAACGECAGHARVRAMEPFARLVRGGHRLLAHSGFARDRATVAFGRGIALLPLGIDTVHFRPTPDAALAPAIARLSEERGRPRVLVLGPPTPARGGHRILDLLIALHARLGDLELVVAGTDPTDPDAAHVLLAEAKELGVASLLRLLPRVSRSDLPALLASADVGVAHGLAPEPTGLAMIQALACGLPVVAHPAGAAPALLEGGRAGVLASAREMGPFADAVSLLLKDEPARVAIREQARLVAIERHDVERFVFDMETLYERVRTPRTGREGAPRVRRTAA
ncbi:MAG: glycosyltransferase family 4 protein [Candidatus Eisenbacteria bacterium]|nr:glycosyltransferase family 4 protein [Candidatus Eisenbacteria bacterium]